MENNQHENTQSNEFWGGKNGSKLLTNKLGDYVIEKMGFIHILDGQGGDIAEAFKSPLHSYNDKTGLYKPVFEGSQLDRVLYSFVPQLTNTQVRDTIKYIKAIAPIKVRPYENIIAFKGGLVNINTLETVEPNPDLVVTADMTHVQYDRAITDCLELDKFMFTLFGNNEDKHKLIYEIIGYGLANNNFMQKFFIFYGKGGDGKSTLLNLITALYGKKNVSNISLADIQSRFRTHSLYGKMLNIGDDIGKGMIADTADLKKIVSGEPIIMEQKGRQPFDYTPTVKMLFSSNEVPRINDTSRGMNDRLMIIPFHNRLRHTAQANPDIISDLMKTNALTVLLNRALEGLGRLLETKQFTRCHDVEELTQKQILNNNNCALFIDEVERGELTYSDLGISSEYNSDDTIFSIGNTEGKLIYEAYKYWAKENSYRVWGRNNFLEVLKDCGYSQKVTKLSVKGKNVKVWRK